MSTTSYLDVFDDIEQQGAGIDADVEGQAFEVRRLSATTPATGVPTDIPIATINAVVERITSRSLIENQTFDLLVFRATMDVRTLQKGDVLREIGYGATSAGVFTYAQKRPQQDALVVRTEATATISREFSASGMASQQPVSGTLAMPGYSGTTPAIEQVLTLINGAYAYAPNGATSALVQVGLQPISRFSDQAKPKMPTALYRERFMLYVPLLPGVALRENDRINIVGGERYEVAIVYSSGATGFVGHIIVAERLD